MSTLELDDNACAVIWTPAKGFSLMMPEPSNKDAQVPEQILAMTEIMLRLDREPEFVTEMAGDFRRRAGS